MEVQSSSGFQGKLNQLNEKLNNLSNFVIGKLKNYRNLSLGEQISYPMIGGGILLVFVSIILFII